MGQYMNSGEFVVIKINQSIGTRVLPLGVRTNRNTKEYYKSEIAITRVVTQSI